MKRIVDERIIGLQKRYGFEALYLGSFLIFIDFMVRIVVFKKGFYESIDLYLIFVLPWLYYAVRGLFAGVFTAVKKQQRLINKLAGVFFSVVLLLVTLLGFANDGETIKYASSDFLLGFVIGLAIVAAGAILVIIVSKRRLKKSEEEEQ